MQTAGHIAQQAERHRNTLAWLTGEKGIVMPLLFLSPFLIFFVVFLLYPIANGFYISLTKWDLLTPKEWVGLENYRNLTSDYLFRKSLRNTFIFVGLNVPLSVIVPLFLAVMVDHPILGRGIFRSIFSTPLMMSVTTVSILWVWFLNPTFGLINHYLGMFGLPDHFWLNERPWAMVAIVITTVWWLTGFNMILFLAGLQDIPDELYDAAKTDGAGSWSLFRNITLPGLRPTLLFVLATTIIGSFRVFGQVYVMTNAGGGPFDSTRTLVFHIYETGFRNFRMGSASAVAWVLFFIVAVFTLIQFRLLQERD
jgi:multiple sugar transport system permease protein